MCDFPFASELTDVGFGFFVDVQGAEIAGSGRLVHADVGCGAMFPVFDQNAQVLDPFLPAILVGSLAMSAKLSAKK